MELNNNNEQMVDPPMKMDNGRMGEEPMIQEETDQCIAAEQKNFRDKVGLLCEGKSDRYMKGEKKVFTKLVDKHYSPLLIRKYTHWGFPIYVGMITDDDLSDLDDVFVEFMGINKNDSWVNNIQKLRNLAGALTEHLNEHYSRAEGVAVVFYVDKCFISSLHGDFMNHTSCRIEFYGLLNMSTGV